MISVNKPSKVSPVNDSDKAEITVGARARTNQVLFLDRAVMAVKQREGRLDFSRADLVLDGALRRAAEILGEPVPVAA